MQSDQETCGERKVRWSDRGVCDVTAPHLSLPALDGSAGLQVKHKQREVTYRKREAQRVVDGEITPHEHLSLM